MSNQAPTPCRHRQADRLRLRPSLRERMHDAVNDAHLRSSFAGRWTS